MGNDHLTLIRIVPYVHAISPDQPRFIGLLEAQAGKETTQVETGAHLGPLLDTRYAIGKQPGLGPAQKR